MTMQAHASISFRILATAYLSRNTSEYYVMTVIYTYYCMPTTVEDSYLAMKHVLSLNVLSRVM